MRVAATDTSHRHERAERSHHHELPIIILEFVFVVPALVVLWLRPATSRRTKWIATAILVAIPTLATIIDCATG